MPIESKIIHSGFDLATRQISLEEYLRTSYHPDRDYVDGAVQERNWGEFDHAFAQAFLGSWFYQYRQEWQGFSRALRRPGLEPRPVRVAQPIERLTDYRRIGLQNVWVIDPANRVGYDCSTTAWLPVEEFRIAGSAIFLRLSDLWNELQANH